MLLIPISVWRNEILRQTDQLIENKYASLVEDVQFMHTAKFLIDLPYTKSSRKGALDLAETMLSSSGAIANLIFDVNCVLSSLCWSSKGELQCHALAMVPE